MSYATKDQLRSIMTDAANKTKTALSFKADSSSVPSKLEDLTDDATHRTVTDSEKTSWNNKADLSNIPTALSSLTDDATHRTVTDTEKSTWGGKQNALTFDTTPTNNSTNPVTSGGIKNAVDAKASISVTTTDPGEGSTLAANTLLVVVEEHEDANGGSGNGEEEYEEEEGGGEFNGGW